MTTEVSFEKALERLEKIVEELESGEISLDEALKKYEEGVKLSRACQERLREAEKKIEILTRSKDGTLKRENFSPERALDESADNEKKKNTKAPAKGKTLKSDLDEDLLI